MAPIQSTFATTQGVHEEVIKRYPEEQQAFIRQHGAKLMELADPKLKGFVIDLGVYTNLTGESKKHTLDKLKPKFTEGADYTSFEQRSDSSSRGPPAKKYMLTPYCFEQLLMIAPKKVGEYARSYFSYCSACWRETILNEVNKKRALPDATESSRKRVKAGDSMLGLMQSISSSSTKNMNCGDYATINGLTNQAATGATKSDWAKNFGVQASKLNLRDHMTSTGLAFTEAIQLASQAAIEKNSNADPIEVHKRVCQQLACAFQMAYDRTVEREVQQKLPEARKAVVIADGRLPAIQGPEQSKKIANVPKQKTTLSRFFKAKSK